MYPTIESSVSDIFDATWNITNGTKVPATEDIVMKNGGKLVDATYLYADLAGSSQLAHKATKEAAAMIIRAYINSASRILRHFGGEIRSFDGDRVMAIFMGDDKNTKAVRAAYGINWAVREVIAVQMKNKWSDVPSVYEIGHGIGIDTGEALIVRGGVRNNNDLISVGDAPNDAARLSEYRSYPINITGAVYDALTPEVLKAGDGTAMFSRRTSGVIPGAFTPTYHSNGLWEV